MCHILQINVILNSSKFCFSTDPKICIFSKNRSLGLLDFPPNPTPSILPPSFRGNLRGVGIKQGFIAYTKVWNDDWSVLQLYLHVHDKCI